MCRFLTASLILKYLCAYLQFFWVNKCIRELYSSILKLVFATMQILFPSTHQISMIIFYQIWSLSCVPLGLCFFEDQNSPFTTGFWTMPLHLAGAIELIILQVKEFVIVFLLLPISSKASTVQLVFESNPILGTLSCERSQVWKIWIKKATKSGG